MGVVQFAAAQDAQARCARPASADLCNRTYIWCNIYTSRPLLAGAADRRAVVLTCSGSMSPMRYVFGALVRRRVALVALRLSFGC